MIERINKWVFGLILLSYMSSSAFAVNGGTGYIWMPSLIGYYDAINYVGEEVSHIPKADLNKGLPEINSVIKIEPKNKMYNDLSMIQDISKEFRNLVKQKKCENAKGSFSSFMANGTSECSVDNVVKNMENTYINENLYIELIAPVKAKVLGYVPLKEGLFVLIQIIEVIKENK